MPLDPRLCDTCGYEFTPHELEEVYDPATRTTYTPEQTTCDDCLKDKQND